MKKKPTNVEKVDLEEWEENNPWIYDEPLFSYNDLKTGINLQVLPVGNPALMQKTLMDDLREAAFSKAYQQVEEIKKSIWVKEKQELNDRLLFGSDLAKGESWTVLDDDKAGLEFRERLFWELFELHSPDPDIKEIVSMVNRTWNALRNGIYGIDTSYKPDNDGTD